MPLSSIKWGASALAAPPRIYNYEFAIYDPINDQAHSTTGHFIHYKSQIRKQ